MDPPSLCQRCRAWVAKAFHLHRAREGLDEDLAFNQILEVLGELNGLANFRSWQSAKPFKFGLKAAAHPPLRLADSQLLVGFKVDAICKTLSQPLSNLSQVLGTLLITCPRFG